MRKVALLAMVAMFGLVATGYAQVAATQNLLDSPVKMEGVPASVGETVKCTLTPLPGGSLFGTDEIGGTSPVVLMQDELFGSFRVATFDENCALLSTWLTAFAGTTQTGITHDDATGTTHWIVNPGALTIDEYFDGTGLPAGGSVGVVGLLVGSAAIDNNQAGKLCYTNDIVADNYTEVNLVSGALGCSFANPDNTGSGAFGNGHSDAVSPADCSGATMVVASGLIGEGQVTRASQTDCSGTLCYTTWDIGGPTNPSGEFFVNGIEEFAGASGKCLAAAGNVTGIVFLIGKPVGIADCQGQDSPDSDVVFWNSSQGGGDFTVPFEASNPIGLSIQDVPNSAGGKFVAHLNAGTPSGGTLATLPAGLGTSCFDFLVSPSGSGSPASVWNNVGKTNLVGDSNYFGAPIADPAKAPTYFEARAAGDTVNFPNDSDWTLQAIILNATASGNKPGSVTNGVIGSETP